MHDATYRLSRQTDLLAEGVVCRCGFFESMPSSIEFGIPFCISYSFSAPFSVCRTAETTAAASNTSSTIRCCSLAFSASCRPRLWSACEASRCRAARHELIPMDAFLTPFLHIGQHTRRSVLQCQLQMLDRTCRPDPLARFT